MPYFIADHGLDLNDCLKANYYTGEPDENGVIFSPSIKSAKVIKSRIDAERVAEALTADYEANFQLIFFPYS